MAKDSLRLSDVLRCPQAPVNINTIETGATPETPGGKGKTAVSYTHLRAHETTE